MIPGVDVGSPQGTITPVQWRAMNAAGRAWVIARCTQGASGKVDPTFTANVANAKGLGLPVGAYFVYVPGEDPEAQAAAWFAASGALGSHLGELPPAIDFEEASKTITPRQEIDALVVIIQAMTVAWGRPPLLYTYPDFWRRVVATATPDELAVIATCLLWYASYLASGPTAPAPWTKATFWQRGGGTTYRLPPGGPFAGAACDDDVFLGTQAELEELASFVLDVGPNPLAGVTVPGLVIPGENA